MRQSDPGENLTENPRPAVQLAEVGASPADESPAAERGHVASAKINPVVFRRRLMSWYRQYARELPWRNTSDPYRIWVSEIMLQQTRVAAVIDHYHDFLRRFPTLLALALAEEHDVLAAWSGLGYYRRARMLHKAAQFITLELGGRFPNTSAELRTLPGIGDYTAAAIASIVFGENVAVIDGNVERVILRLTGLGEGEGRARLRARIREQAQELVPTKHLRASRGDGAKRALDANAAGDHNQAMMELGAMICLPRAPLCLNCPVYTLCRTRGERPAAPRPRQLSRSAAYLLDLRRRGSAIEVLLERRPEDAALMPGMYELPPLPLDSVAGREPVLRVRHAITNTNYYVQVYSTQRAEQCRAERQARAAGVLRRSVPVGSRDLRWVRTSRLMELPLTGLARKALQRLRVMESARPSISD